MKKTIIILFLVSIIFAGCAYNPPVPALNQLGNKAILDMPFNQAWQKTINVLYSEGYAIKVADKENGIITTERKLVRLDETSADCGNIWGIPSTKDKRTTTYVVYSVNLQKNSDKSNIIVNTHIEGIFNAMAGSETQQLSCYSLGYLEGNLINKIK